MEQQLSHRLGINEVKTLARTIPTLPLWKLMQGNTDATARNAAWILTHKTDAEVATLPQQQLIDLAMTTPEVALRRLALHLISRQPMGKEDLRADFLDYCLQHMTLLEEPSGVQALCMKLAHSMCRYYPELQKEFADTLKLMHIEHYKPGVKHLAGKLRKQRSESKKSHIDSTPPR